jgi:alkyldihydroxyacetonephosphate synthase
MGEGDMFASFRVTQLYETGAAVYVYFSVNYKSLELDVVCDIYEDIEHETRKIVLQHGGSISHHHGVGKLRKRFMEKSFDSINMYQNIY